jgi:ubiquinone/menaquinone biosynthesis C-methylase UbiE
MPISNFVTPPPLEGADHWSDWLASTRRLRSERDLADVTRYADRVLDGARLAENHTLLDVGTGEGLVAFRAIERLGPDIRVVASDASSMALAYAASQARELGVAHQIRFVQCTAEHMLEVGTSSVNAITTRSVLAYVPDKIAALNEVKRILKPGGKLSMAEPIFQDDAMGSVAQID